MDRDGESVKKTLQKNNTAKSLLIRSMELIRLVGAKTLDHIYPPVCMHCRAVTGVSDLLCAPCWAKLRPITQPLCPILGLPFEYYLGEGGLSAEAIVDPPPFNRARSACVHNGVAKALITRLKFGDREEIATFCARMMVVAGAQLFGAKTGEGFGGETAPVLVPVPLHRGRQWQRRYNQSTLLARAICRQSGLTMEPMIIRRIKPTRPQIGLSSKQRTRNVAGAFQVQPDILQRLNGRSVLIVDDVITTGATVKAISVELAKNGVEKIDVISFSRVVKGIEDEQI